MSKASEWAKLSIMASKCPKFKLHGAILDTASVKCDSNGDAKLSIFAIEMTAIEALAFAKWIEETFGETETK